LISVSLTHSKITLTPLLESSSVTLISTSKVIIGNLDLGLELGTWNLERGTWNLELGTWNLELGTWNLELGTWNLELGTWNLEL
jgi:hypothetical protein